MEHDPDEGYVEELNEALRHYPDLDTLKFHTSDRFIDDVKLNFIPKLKCFKVDFCLDQYDCFFHMNTEKILFDPK